MTAEDEHRVHALVHNARVLLSGTHADVADIQNVRDSVTMAEKFLRGEATDADRRSVPTLVHPAVTSDFFGH